MTLFLRILATLLILGTLVTSQLQNEQESIMTLSIEKQLIRDEGMSLEVYLDHLGKPTVGVGHLVTSEDKLKVGDTISNSQALKLFRKDVKTARKDATIFVGVDKFRKLSPNMQNVVTNMAFNLGATKLAKFKEFKKAVREGDHKAMVREMKDSKWYKQVPNRADRLIAVVEEEASLEENGGEIFVEAYTRVDGVKIPAHFRKKSK